MNDKQLFDLIQSTGAARTAYEAGNDASVLAALATRNIPRTDDTPRRSSWIQDNEKSGLTDDEVETVLRTLQGSDHPRVIDAYQLLTSGGLDFSNAKLQQMLAWLGNVAGWDQELIDKVAAWGVWTASPAEVRFGRDVTVSAEDIAAARAWGEIAALKQTVVDNYNATVTAIDNGTITDAAAAVTALTSSLT